MTYQEEEELRRLFETIRIDYTEEANRLIAIATRRGTHLVSFEHSTVDRYDLERFNAETTDYHPEIDGKCGYLASVPKYGKRVMTGRKTPRPSLEQIDGDVSWFGKSLECAS